MLKNRTLIGIVLIVAAIGLCFGISPLFNTILASKTTIIRLKQDIPQGVQITGSMLEAVEVGTMNLPADMQNDPKKIIGKYSVTAMFAGDSFNDKKLSDTIDFGQPAPSAEAKRNRYVRYSQISCKRTFW